MEQALEIRARRTGGQQDFGIGPFQHIFLIKALMDACLQASGKSPVACASLESVASMCLARQ
jgi:hypothetical protein